MPPRTTLSVRWVTAIMAVAVVCSVAVVWGLIQITDNSPASSSTVAPVEPSVSPSGEPPSASAGSASTDSSNTDDAGTQSAGADSGVPVTAATASALPGSGVPLPAAWTGTAELTITVTGRCAESGGTSSYTRAAELALQPAPETGPFADPNPMALSLGITPAGVPGVSVYSASTEDSGAVHRTWWLATGSDLGRDGESRTAVSGVLIDDQPVAGELPPNLLVDNETDLQPCESSDTVRVPRTLAVGSTIDGWVSPTKASLRLQATTVDGERKLSAVVDLTRRPAP